MEGVPESIQSNMQKLVDKLSAMGTMPDSQTHQDTKQIQVVYHRAATLVEARGMAKEATDSKYDTAREDIVSWMRKAVAEVKSDEYAKNPKPHVATGREQFIMNHDGARKETVRWSMMLGTLYDASEAAMREDRQIESAGVAADLALSKVPIRFAAWSYARDSMIKPAVEKFVRSAAQGGEKEFIESVVAKDVEKCFELLGKLIMLEDQSFPGKEEFMELASAIETVLANNGYVYTSKNEKNRRDGVRDANPHEKMVLHAYRVSPMDASLRV